MDDYDLYFNKFYTELFKFQNGKKSSLRCPGCESKKRFIVDKDKLTFSCGPKTSAKCGPQYTIELPKYIHFRDLQKVYDDQINGSFDYEKDNRLEYDLKTLSQKMDATTELAVQQELVKSSHENLKRLIDDYIKINSLEGYIETLETLSEKRYKNAIDKRKIMRMIMEDELSEPEKKDLRIKYAHLIRENGVFIDMIMELRKPNIDFIMIKEPSVTKHTSELNIESAPEEPQTKLSKGRVTMKVRWSILYVMYKVNELKSVSIKELYKNISQLRDITEGLFAHGNAEPEIRTRVSEMNRDGFIERIGEKGSGEYKITEKGNKYLEEMNKEFNKTPQEESQPKYTYDDQIQILTEYYGKVDPQKTTEDIKRIINRRRPEGKPIGTRVPSGPWLSLCDKLSEKYEGHPLKKD